MLASYHNHTSASDGKGAPEALIAAAVRLGVGELGVSDHFVLPARGRPPDWAMPLERVEPHLARLAALKASAPIQLLAGLETDWFPARAAEIAAALGRLRPDFAIGSAHYVEPGAGPIDAEPRRLKDLSPSALKATLAGYWARVAELADSGLFRIAAHLDLPKKFGVPCDEGHWPAIEAALGAVAGAGMAVELNTSGWHMPCREQYPSARILARCLGLGIPVLLSSDSHSPGHVVRDFGRAVRLLKGIGFASLARLDGPGFAMLPIEEVESDLRA